MTTAGGTLAPVLTGDALRAVEHEGSHLQIIASAGSGKTEVVSQRVARLVASEERPDGIVASELKSRIALRVEERSGREALDLLGNPFVGTIHSYCFRLLQLLVPRYGCTGAVEPGVSQC